MNNKLKKTIKYTSIALGAAFVAVSVVAKKKKPKSEYADRPKEQNPMKGKRVIFVENENDPINADGKHGHLEAIGESSHIPTLYERYVKRGLDIILSFGGLVVLSPIYVAAAIAIKIDDPGPVLFKQKRVAQSKGFFELMKFRSMKLNTPKNIPTHMLDDPDRYLLKSGKLFRKLSIDELPQLFNILMGNMSVIGPRPALWNQDYLTAERDKYGANDIKPGLTGLAQAHGRDELEIPDKAKLDGEYAAALKRSSWSGLKMDIKVFVDSVKAVLRSDGVVEGGTGEMHKQENSEKVS